MNNVIDLKSRGKKLSKDEERSEEFENWLKSLEDKAKADKERHDKDRQKRNTEVLAQYKIKKP